MDLGHTPFGHAGERALNELCPDGFKHYMQSLRVVDKLEKDGRGLNLDVGGAQRHRDHTRAPGRQRRKGASCAWRIRSPM